MSIKIFYSWQSDLKPTRNYIDKELKKAIKSNNKNLPANDQIELLDSVRGISGSPNILATILKRIESSDIFIADLSIINRPHRDSDRHSFRLTPNPNVLIEYGYAKAFLGEERIIILFDTESGTGDMLPFDVSKHRLMLFSSKNGDLSINLNQSILFIIKQNATKNIVNVFRNYNKQSEIVHDLRIINKIFESFNFTQLFIFCRSGLLNRIPYGVLDMASLIDSHWVDGDTDKILNKELKRLVFEFGKNLNDAVSYQDFVEPKSDFYKIENIDEDLEKAILSQRTKLDDSLQELFDYLRSDYQEFFYRFSDKAREIPPTTP